MLCRPKPIGYFWPQPLRFHTLVTIPALALPVGLGTSMALMVIAKALRAGGLALPFAVVCAPAAMAQLGYPGAPPPTASAAPAAPAARSPACLRLEGQLAMIDRGGVDPAKAEQIKRNEDAAAKQQGELDRLTQQAQRLGCAAGFLSLFNGQSQQCIPLNNQIQQVRTNLNYYLSENQRLQGDSGEREAQRRSVLAALGQNDCGPQYRQYANAGPGGFFETLFGISSVPSSSIPGMPLSGTYRTLCVRTCDGYYFPISYSTMPGKFAEDEALCRRLCPATEVALYSHRNPGEDVARAVSLNGRSYTDLPTAFSYRKALNPACSCRAPGQSWEEALRQGDDQTIERGDIVVTEERAKQLSQPRFNSQGKPVNADPSPARQAPPGNAKPGVSSASSPPAADAATPSDKAEEDPAKRKVRAVGPAFYPVR